MIKFGVIGTSWITERFLNCAKLNNDFKLNAVYSRTENRAKEFADKYGVKNIFTDVEAMAKSDCIDAVYIASPNSLHSKYSLIFLENEKHVFCEKPIASDLYQLNSMIDKAKEKNVLLMEGMVSSFLPNFQSIKDNLHKIGKIRRYVANFCRYSSRYDQYKRGENPNTFNPEFSNGSLMDIGVYGVHPVLHLFGEPDSIKANGVLLESGVDGEGSVVLTYEDMDAIIIHSKISNSYMPSEIQGEEGSMIIDKLSTPQNVKIVYKNGEEEDITVEQLEAKMYYEATEFIELIKSGETESSINTFDISRKAMKILEESRRQMGVIYPSDREK
ncbi:Gfo/Idh/MocA family oxidoreductase [Clostridium sp. D2Q-11]|uniref:Gfo/Idh/MocA family oxidoreductase n=1 Tax=Anaeromonas frigoriresistens TaxID=2683708 RepID=A0A942UT55_9FIRM|nr:Gfo/Idh/MocA family oxidoreductase [Anaeromonas frigoriresistens]MBS4538108.1 Gfo/Idh/MocA family oxidoreductase [Anaeromonas frigoriresistens]